MRLLQTIFADLRLTVLGVGVLLLAWLIVRWLARPRTRAAARACRGCETQNPPHAGFCRRCGRKLA